MKFVAVEQIKGLFSGIIYAEKFDEVELTIERLGVSQFRNLRTGDLFDARNERCQHLEDTTITEQKPRLSTWLRKSY